MLETQFYIRFVLNILFGIMFVYALVRMAKHNNREVTPQKHVVMKVLGGIFLFLSVLCLISCIVQLFGLMYRFPTHMQQPPLGKWPIIRHSSVEICWGYPTPRQFAVLSSVLGIFTMLGLAGYFFYYRSSKSSWWKKLGKFLACSLLLVFLYSATNFQYFDFWEFIAPILFLTVWLHIMSRTTAPEGAKSSNESNVESPVTERPPKGHRFAIKSVFFETPKTISQGVDESTREGEAVQPKSNIPSIDFQGEQTKESVKPIDKALSSDKNSFCSYCGTKVEPDALFCTHCGRRL
ncbi:MAG: zinc ribbon domain-containing protein [Bacteroides sp.]|nr:zinc ribbon domain-containing protein [Bacteroides sp.]MCM1086027.1 zinc ribbon domain-containing protein [Bacteroides sp.]